MPKQRVVGQSAEEHSILKHSFSCPQFLLPVFFKGRSFGATSPAARKGSVDLRLAVDVGTGPVTVSVWLSFHLLLFFEIVSSYGWSRLNKE